MIRVAVCAVLLGCMLGCHGSQQSYNLLAPYGSCRVPPPATGNHTVPAGYYSPTTPPTVSVPTIQNSSTLGAPSAQTTQNGSTQVASGTWQPAGTASQTSGSGVQQAAFNAPAKSGAGGSAGSSSLNLNGMHVNDATNQVSPAEPGRFAPPYQTAPIQQSPPTAGTQSASGTVVSSAKASDNISPGTTPSTASSGSTLKWGPRY